MQQRKYSDSVCISFHAESNTTSALLMQKVSGKHGTKTKLIHANFDDNFTHPKFDALGNIDCYSKLYLHGHGTGDDTDHLYNDEMGKIHYKDLAALLASRLQHPSLKLSSIEQYLKISLVMCESVDFAEKLHYELSKHGIYCSVAGRIFPVLIDSNGHVTTVSRDIDAAEFSEIQKQLNSTTEQLAGFLQAKRTAVKKQNASKVVYYWNAQQKQMQKDGYQGKWKKNILQLLHAEIEKQEQVHALDLLVTDIRHAQNNEQMLAILMSARNGKNYDLIFPKPHTNIFLIKLTQLIEEGENILQLKQEGCELLTKDQPCYRYFATSTQVNSTTKTINDCLLQCRDTMTHPPARLDGLNRLLADVDNADSIKNKLKILQKALLHPQDPYKLNEFEKNTFMTFSLFAPFTTRVYSIIDNLYRETLFNISKNDLQFDPPLVQHMTKSAL